MWSFQGPRAVYSPEESTENVTSNHRRSLSHPYTDSTTLPNSPVPEYHQHPAEIETVTPVAPTPRYSKQELWPESASGSTLTRDKEPLEVYDIEHEEKQSSDASVPVPFWSTALKTTRKYVFVRYAWTLLVLCIFVLGVLSIYWGVLFRIKENLHSATIAVVDFDGSTEPYLSIEPIVGPFVVAATREALRRPHALGYATHDPAQYNHDPLAVRRAIHHEDIWGAIVINPNASSLLRQAVEHGNTSYDAAGACQIIYNQARDVESYNQYIIPTLLRLSTEISNNFTRQWTASVLSNTSLSPTTYATTPQALSPGIAFTDLDLRPFDPPVAIPAVSIGLIYLIIIAFFSFSFFMPIHSHFLSSTSPSPHPPLKFTHLILWRYLATTTAYLFLSLAYSLVSLAFQIPFTHTPPPGTNPSFPTDQPIPNANLVGPATFLIYYLLNFLGMSALGLPLEVAAMLLPTTQPWTSLFLIFWVITNVSTGFYALELAPGFYRWGYGWPLRQIVYGSRALLFGTRSQLGLNFGVLVAWVVVATVAWVPSCWVLRGRGRGKMAREQASGSVGGGGGGGVGGGRSGGMRKDGGMRRMSSVKENVREGVRRPRVWVMKAFNNSVQT